MATFLFWWSYYVCTKVTYVPPLSTTTYSTTYHSRASECLQNIRGTDSVVFVLILNPQMCNILLLKSVPWAQPQISNKIMCPYYPYVVLYLRLTHLVVKDKSKEKSNSLFYSNLSTNMIFHTIIFLACTSSIYKNLYYSTILSYYHGFLYKTL